MTLILSGTNGVTSVNGSAAAPSVTGTDTDTGIVYGTNTITLSTGGTAGLVQDASQNVALGFSPSGTAGAWKSFELGQAGSGFIAGYGETDFVNNLKGDRVGAFSWVSTGYAGRFNLSAGVYSWTAGTGSAGNQFVANGHTTSLNTNGVFVLSGGNTSATGVGIAFPATQSASTDANTLDDYEEGTWTPAWSVSGGTISALGGGTYTPGGTYTKIGNTVYIRGYISYGGVTGTPSGALAISGLPFTPGTGFGQSQTFAGGITVLSVGLWLSGAPEFAQIIPSATTTNSIGYRTSTGSAASTYADMDKNTNYSQFVFQGQYTV